MNRLQGKVCVITAASTGIGLAMAVRFAQEGASVIISSRSQKHVDHAVDSCASQDLSIAGVVCHVGKAGDRVKLVQFAGEKYGRIDILVCNAAVSTHVGPSMSISEAAYDKMFDVNVKSVLFLVQEALPLLTKAAKPNILIVSSISAYTVEEGLGVYGMTKTALLGMTRMLANELASYNMRVNCIAPGVIKTRFSEAIWDSPAATDSPLKRMGTVEEVSGAAAFLCSEDASYITGETLVMAGGNRSRL